MTTETTKHATTKRANVGTYQCSCTIWATPVHEDPKRPAWVCPDAEIRWCPTHAAALEMAELLRAYVARYEPVKGKPGSVLFCARALLRRIEGE